MDGVQQNHGSGWSTSAEIDFLNNMGTGKFRASQITVSKEVLLKGYLKGCKLRKVWGNIDKKVVVNHAQTILAALR